MIDRAKPVMLRNGTPVRILTWDGGPIQRPVVGVVEHDSNQSYARTWRADGTDVDRAITSLNDLVNVSEPTTRYISIYDKATGGSWPTLEDSREYNLDDPNYVGALGVTWDIHGVINTQFYGKED